MIFEKICLGPFQVNCYILAQAQNKRAIIIDPGSEPDKVKKILARHKLSPAFIINTHGHFDHIGADDAFGVPVYIHKADLDFLDNPQLNLSGMLSMPLRISASRQALEDGDELKIDKIGLKVLHTPGHTPGGICLLLKEPQDNILFSGDTLFCRGIGRTDLPLASFEQLKNSIREKLFVLDSHMRVYPGHGPATTIGREKKWMSF